MTDATDAMHGGGHDERRERVAVTIRVLYSCPVCGLRAQPVDVVARQRGEPFERWMKKLSLGVGADHARRRPRCMTRRLRDLKIPVDGAEWVGGPPLQ